MSTILWITLLYVAILGIVAGLAIYFYKKNNRPRITLFEKERASHILEEESPPVRAENFEELYERFAGIVEKDKLFLDPDLRVSGVAEKIYTNRSYLAQAIKFKTGKNFCQIVNQFRIKEAMRVYAMDPNLSAEQLSRIVGFNSMTTFNTAFRLNTGYTPSEWCKTFRKKNRLNTPNEKD